MNLFEKFFGFALKSSDKDERIQDNLKSFIPPTQRDGAITIDQQNFNYGGYFYSTPYQANRLANEFELVTKYRQMALHPIVAKAIEEICNDAIVSDDAGAYKLFINLDNTKLSPELKEKTIKCFEEVLKIVNYSTEAYNLFRQSYIDGKLYNAIIINEEKKEEGIKDVRLFDPRQIQLIRDIKRDTQVDMSQYGNSAALVRMIDEVEEYFVFNPYGIYSTYVNSAENITGVRMETDSISYVTSGLMDAENLIVISYLEQAAKVLNQLSDLEDSIVIYRMSRSTEKRVFYVGVGRLSHSKASEYVRKIAEKYKTKIVYDPSTGKVDLGTNQRSLVDDYFIPTREGDTSTKIETLQGGSALDSIPDLEYFDKLLKKSLNVPTTRLQESSAYSIGKSSEITRDEISFKKFITRLQLKFAEFPLQLLKVQLELKGIMRGEDFDTIKQDIVLDFTTDNFFYEMKEAEILSVRASTANDIGSVNEVHQIFSSKWIKRNIFKLTDEEIAQNDIEIKEERMKRAAMGMDNPESEDETTPDTAPTEDQSLSSEIDTIEKLPSSEGGVEKIPDSGEKIEKDEETQNALDLISKYIKTNTEEDSDEFGGALESIANYVNNNK